MNDEGRPAGGPRRLPQLVARRSQAPAVGEQREGLVRLGTSPEWKAQLRRLAALAPEPYASRLRAIAERRTA